MASYTLLLIRNAFDPLYHLDTGSGIQSPLFVLVSLLYAYVRTTDSPAFCGALCSIACCVVEPRELGQSNVVLHEALGLCAASCVFEDATRQVVLMRTMVHALNCATIVSCMLG